MASGSVGDILASLHVVAEAKIKACNDLYADEIDWLETEVANTKRKFLVVDKNDLSCPPSSKKSRQGKGRRRRSSSTNGMMKPKPKKPHSRRSRSARQPRRSTRLSSRMVDLDDSPVEESSPEEKENSPGNSATNESDGSVDLAKRGGRPNRLLPPVPTEKDSAAQTSVRSPATSKRPSRKRKSSEISPVPSPAEIALLSSALAKAQDGRPSDASKRLRTAGTGRVTRSRRRRKSAATGSTHASPSSVPDSATWACSACTVLNSEGRHTCSMCGRARARGTRSTRRKAQSSNDKSEPLCEPTAEQCETKKEEAEPIPQKTRPQTRASRRRNRRKNEEAEVPVTESVEKQVDEQPLAEDGADTTEAEAPDPAPIPRRLRTRKAAPVEQVPRTTRMTRAQARRQAQEMAEASNAEEEQTEPEVEEETKPRTRSRKGRAVKTEDAENKGEESEQRAEKEPQPRVTRARRRRNHRTTRQTRSQRAKKVVKEAEEETEEQVTEAAPEIPGEESSQTPDIEAADEKEEETVAVRTRSRRTRAAAREARRTRRTRRQEKEEKEKEEKEKTTRDGEGKEKKKSEEKEREEQKPRAESSSTDVDAFEPSTRSEHEVDETEDPQDAAQTQTRRRKGKSRAIKSRRGKTKRTRARKVSPKSEQPVRRLPRRTRKAPTEFWKVPAATTKVRSDDEGQNEDVAEAASVEVTPSPSPLDETEKTEKADDSSSSNRSSSSSPSPSPAPRQKPKRGKTSKRMEKSVVAEQPKRDNCEPQGSGHVPDSAEEEVDNSAAAALQRVQQKQAQSKTGPRRKRKLRSRRANARMVPSPEPPRPAESSTSVLEASSSSVKEEQRVEVSATTAVPDPEVDVADESTPAITAPSREEEETHVDEEREVEEQEPENLPVDAGTPTVAVQFTPAKVNAAQSVPMTLGELSKATPIRPHALPPRLPSKGSSTSSGLPRGLEEYVKAAKPDTNHHAHANDAAAEASLLARLGSSVHNAASSASKVVRSILPSWKRGDTAGDHGEGARLEEEKAKRARTELLYQRYQQSSKEAIRKAKVVKEQKTQLEPVETRQSPHSAEPVPVPENSTLSVRSTSATVSVEKGQASKDSKASASRSGSKKAQQNAEHAARNKAKLEELKRRVLALQSASRSTASLARPLPTDARSISPLGNASVQTPETAPASAVSHSVPVATREPRERPKLLRPASANPVNSNPPPDTNVVTPVNSKPGPSVPKRKSDTRLSLLVSESKSPQSPKPAPHAAHQQASGIPRLVRQHKRLKPAAVATSKPAASAEKVIPEARKQDEAQRSGGDEGTAETQSAARDVQALSLNERIHMRMQQELKQMGVHPSSSISPSSASPPVLRNSPSPARRPAQQAGISPTPSSANRKDHRKPAVVDKKMKTLALRTKFIEAQRKRREEAEERRRQQRIEREAQMKQAAADRKAREIVLQKKKLKEEEATRRKNEQRERRRQQAMKRAQEAGAAKKLPKPCNMASGRDGKYKVPLPPSKLKRQDKRVASSVVEAQAKAANRGPLHTMPSNSPHGRMSPKRYAARKLGSPQPKATVRPPAPVGTPPQQSYAMSDHEKSDWSESDTDSSPGHRKKKVPAWAAPRAIEQQLRRQQRLDPDTVFPPEWSLPNEVNLERIFNGYRISESKRRRFNNRHESGNWTREQLAFQAENEAYKRAMGYIS